MRRQHDSESSVRTKLTLDEYFYNFFLPGLEVDGRTKATIDDYKRSYERLIQPFHGSKKIDRIKEDAVRRLIRESKTPKKALVTYRSVLNRAKDDELIPKRIDLKGIKFEKPQRKAKSPWTPSEALDAARRLEGEELVELAFLIGMSGLRREEMLAIRPCDMSFIVRQGKDGNETKNLILNITHAYTDIDGFKTTKTPESIRQVAVIPLFQERLLELVEATKPHIVQLGKGQWSIRFHNGWRRQTFGTYEAQLIESTDMREVDRQLKELYPHGDLLGHRPRLIGIKPESGEGYVVQALNGYDSKCVPKYKTVIMAGSREEIEERAYNQWAQTRILNCKGDYLARCWTIALRRKQVRLIPISQLRHTSESLMVAGGISSTTVQKLHGHSTFDTDYRYYIGYGADVLTDTADALNAYLCSINTGLATKTEEVF